MCRDCSPLPLPGPGGYWPGSLLGPHTQGKEFLCSQYNGFHMNYGRSPLRKKTNSQNAVMMYETLSSENGVNGTNGASPGRVSGEEQPVSGRNAATAKLRWTKETNKLAMECYISIRSLNKMITGLTQFETPKSTNYYGISNSKLTSVWTTTSQILCF